MVFMVLRLVLILLEFVAAADALVAPVDAILLVLVDMFPAFVAAAAAFVAPVDARLLTVA